jgi:hypothetical protein
MGRAATLVGMATVEEGVVCVGGVAVGGAFPSFAPLVTEALHSLESRYSTTRVGEEPNRGLGVRGVDGVTAEHLPGGPDAIRRALRG